MTPWELGFTGAKPAKDDKTQSVSKAHWSGGDKNLVVHLTWRTSREAIREKNGWEKGERGYGLQNAGARAKRIGRKAEK